MHKLILASASARRVDLLKQIGITPDEICPANIDETPLKKELAKDYALRMAVSKAEKIAKTKKDCFILSADTVVAMGRTILPKAENIEQAKQCLDMLSGRRHRVYGGICLITPDGKQSVRTIKTSVIFSNLDIEQKEKYLACNDWNGKAGGYAIQGVASLFIREIIGSYSNVVGLSLFETANLLKGNGFQWDYPCV